MTNWTHRIGFLGAGNLAHSILQGWKEAGALVPNKLSISNRSPGKLQKLCELYGVAAKASNEEVVDESDVVFLLMKPQDLMSAIETISSAFRPQQIVVSFAAGMKLQDLHKKIPQVRWARVMANTPISFGRGVLGYLSHSPDLGLDTTLDDLLKPLGLIVPTENEEQLEAITVACASGVGFTFELMMIFQDWLEERGFDPILCRKMVVETFLGASQLAAKHSGSTLEDLQNKVTSKKGVTSAGLESMRELEVERLMRLSFEKADLRNQELSKIR